MPDTSDEHEKLDQALRYQHDVGFDEGYDVGFEEGFELGYQDGYEEGQADVLKTRKVDMGGGTGR